MFRQTWRGGSGYQEGQDGQDVRICASCRFLKKVVVCHQEGLALQHAARELRCEPLVVMRAMKRPWDFGFEVEDLPPQKP